MIKLESLSSLTLYMDQGHLVYEYNMMVIERYTARSEEKLAPGRHIEVDTTIPKPGAPAEVIQTTRRSAARPSNAPCPPF